MSFSSKDHARLHAYAVRVQRSLGSVVRSAVNKFLDDLSRETQLELRFTTRGTTWQEKQHRIALAISRLTSSDWGVPKGSWQSVHDLHPYPTRFVSGVPHALIAALSSPGDVVLDIFCGAGTALVEAARLQRHAIGVDLSPLATLISKVKCTPLNDEQKRAINSSVACATAIVRSFSSEHGSAIPNLSELLLRIRDHCTALGITPRASMPGPDQLENLAHWFPAEALAELYLLRATIDVCPSQQATDLMLVAFSHAVLRVSFQESDTRRAKSSKVIRTGDTLDLWTRKVGDIVERLDTAASARSVLPCEVYTGDARDLSFLRESSVDLVVSSPPYPNAYDYRSAHRLRLLWLGMDSSGKDMGSPRKYKNYSATQISASYKSEVQLTLDSLRRVLRPSALCALIVGDVQRKGATVDTATCVREAARDAGYREITSLPIPSGLTKSRIRPKRFSRNETAVILQAI